MPHSEWEARLRERHLATLSRSISRIESDPAFVLSVAPMLFRATRRCVVGVTGPPGAGKSTLVSRMIRAWRDRGRCVAVLAVDPSSPISGGAVLGDRLRMQEHVFDHEVYIRSLSTRGRLGGLSDTALIATELLRMAGFDRIILETVGVGQNELDIVRIADATAPLFIPGMGDQVQAIKAGLMEIGDVLVLNKSDLPGAAVLQGLLRDVAHRRAQRSGAEPAVIACNALEGEGIVALIDTLDALLERDPDALSRERRAGQLLAAAQYLLKTHLEIHYLDKFTASGVHAAFVEQLQCGGATPFDIVRAFEAQPGHQPAARD